MRQTLAKGNQESEGRLREQSCSHTEATLCILGASIETRIRAILRTSGLHRSAHQCSSKGAPRAKNTSNSQAPLGASWAQRSAKLDTVRPALPNKLTDMLSTCAQQLPDEGHEQSQRGWQPRSPKGAVKASTSKAYVIQRAMRKELAEHCKHWRSAAAAYTCQGKPKDRGSAA